MTAAGRSFGAFLGELKRRRVVRTGAWYAGAAFVLLQAADLVLPRLGASEWVMTALVVAALFGFPLILVLSWAFDLTPGGLQRDEGLGAGTGAEPEGAAGAASAGAGGVRGVSRWARWATVVVVAGATLGAAAVVYRRATAPVAAESVAVLPFAVRGSSLGYLREGMVELLSRNLDGAAGLRAVDPGMVLLLAGREQDGVPLDATTGRRLARSLGAGWFVVGSLIESGEQVRMQAALHRPSDAGAGEPVLMQVEGPADSVFGLVDRLAAGLLAGRGGKQGRRLAQAAAVTTSSLDAFKEYLAAEEHLRAARFDSALAGYRRATELDPGFALGWYRLAVAAGWGNAGGALQDSALDRARAQADHLSPRDRRLLEAFAAFRDGRPLAAESAYLAIRRDYADDLEATFQLADVRFHYNPVLGRPAAEAYALFRDVLRLDPEFLCPI